MTDQVDPSMAPSAGGASSGPTTTGPSSPIAALDAAGRLIAGGSIAVLVILLLGLPVGAWELEGYALVVLIAAIVGLVMAFMASPAAAGASWPVPARDIALLAGVVLSVVAVLNLIEVLFDLDQIDDERGGVVGLLLTIFLALASVAVLAGAVTSREIGGIVGTPLREGDRGTRLAVGGLVLVIVGSLVMLTISVYQMGPTFTFGLTLAVVAATVLLLNASAGSSWSLPFAPAWIAVVLAAIGAYFLIDLTGQVTRQNDRGNLDAIDLLAFALFAIGTLLILAGSIWSAVERQGLIKPRTPAATA